MKEKYYALVLIFFTSLLALILLIKIAGAAGGIMMYSESNTNNVSKYRLWDSFDFSEERDTPAITGGNQVEWIVARSSRTRDQTAIAVMDDDGDLNLNIYNVTNNSFQEWLDIADVGTTNDNYRGFAMRPEGLSGNFVVVYENNITTNRQVHYRIWNGTDWSSEGDINLNSDVTSQPQLIVRVDSKPNSNELMMASAGDADDLSVARWDGDSWENITTITLDSAAVNEEKFAIDYESSSGDAMIAWGNATSASYSIFDNTTKTWSSQQEIRNMGAVVQQVTLCADPNSDYIGALLGPDSLTDIQAVMWNGTEWLSGEPYEEIAAENVATTNAYCTWTNESTALFMYLDNNGYAIRYFIYNKSDETWRCSENNQIVTNLSAAEGSGGPCTTGNIMADDIETLRAELDFNSTNITIWGLDVDFTFEMFTFNGTHIRQSPSFATEKRYYGWNAAVEPAFYTPLKYSGVSPAQGIVFYGEHNETQALKYRLIDNGDYQQEQTAPEIGGTGKALEWFLLRSSTTRNQTAIAVMDDDGDLNVNIYNITSDTFENWTDISDYGTTSDNYRGFGMKTESLSGNFVIVYERAIQNMAGNRLIYYRTFNGTDWSTESSITLNSDVAAEHQVVIRLDSKPNSNELMMGSVGGSDDLSTARWDGDSWENVTTIDLNSAAVDEEKFAIDYETSSGDAMIAWGNATAASYRIFDNTTKSWGTQNQIRERGAVVQQVTLCSDPNSDYIGSLLGPDSTGDVLAVMWNGTEWLSGEPSEEDSAENVAATNAYCTWTNENTALFTYVDLDGLAIRYFIYNRSDDTWRCSENNEIVTSLALAEGFGGPCTTGNIMSNDIETLRSERDPQTGEIILWGNDIDEDFETFTFNGTHIIQPTTALLETTTATAGTTEPGYFSYFKYFPEEEIETDCGTLDSANTVYTLTGNVSSTGTCFTIAAENITLDCNGYFINYSINGTGEQYGVYSNQFNTTIKNCNISNGNWTYPEEYQHGIYFEDSDNGLIFNNTLNCNASNSYGIYFEYADYANILNNTISSYEDYALDINYYSSYNNISYNWINSTNGYSIHLQIVGNDNILSYNNLFNGGIHFQGYSNNTIISNMTIPGILIMDSDHNFTVLDSIILGEVYIGWIGDPGEWNFTNVTDGNGDRFSIIDGDNSDGVLNIMWYFDTNVTYSNGTTIEGANVSIYDINNNILFTENTSSQGLIGRKILLEYSWYNDTTVYSEVYYTPHTINVTKPGFITNSTSYNLTELHNVFTNIFLEIDGGPDVLSPNITFEEPPTPSNASTVYSPNQTIIANISDNSRGSTSSWIDLDRSLVGYWSMDYYNATGIYDNSSYGNFGTFNGNLSVSNITTGVRGDSLAFDGIDNSLMINSIDFSDTNNISVSFWFNPTSTPASGNDMLLEMSFNMVIYQDSFFINFQNDGNISAALNGDAGYSQWYSSTKLTNGNWYYIVVVFDKSLSANETKIYINGELDGVPSETFNSDNSNNFGNRNFYVGSRGTTTEFTNGSFDEIMFFKRSLSETEILALYNSKANKFNATFNFLELGKHNYTVHAIDEAGNYNNSGERNFIVEPDTVYPNVTINFPIGTIADITPLINISVSENSNIWYNVDNGVNITLCNNCNSSQEKFLYAEEGEHTIYIFANDSAGNLNSSIYSLFTINMDNNYYDNFNDNSSIFSKNNIIWNQGNITFSGEYDYLEDSNLISVYEFEDSGNLGTDTKSNNNMSVVGDPVQNTTVPSGKTGYSIELDGDDQICNYSGFTFDPSTNHTMCFWVMKTDFTGDGNVFAQNCVYDTWDTNYDYVFTANNCYNPESPSIENVFSPNQWVHICQTYDSTTDNMIFYINGNENSSHVFANPIEYHPDQAWCIGGCNGGCWMTGNVFEPMWFNRILNSEEISNIYDNTGFNQGNFTSYAINTTENITEITNITWTEINTDTNNNITVQVSADGGVTWYTATSGSSLGQIFTGENNSLIYRVLFATNSSTTIGISDMNISWNEDENQIPGENSCGTLDVANTIYTLTSNVSSQGTCFNISTANVTLDCNGYWINYSILGEENTYGVYTNQFNTTIKNCNIVDGNWTSFLDNRYGIYLNSSNNSNLDRNFVNVSSSFGLYLSNNSNHNNILLNNITSDISSCVYLYSSNNNTFESMNAISTSNGYGVQFEYSSNNSLTNINSSGDFYGFYINYGANNNLTNINSSGDFYGFYINSSSNNNLTDVNSIGGFYGIYLESSSNNNLININATSLDQYNGLSLLSNSNYNILLNVNGSSLQEGYGIHIESSSNNILINSKAACDTDSATFVMNSFNNTFISYNSIGFSSGSKAIYLMNSSNILFRDCINITSKYIDVDLSSIGFSTNNTFINCSYLAEDVAPGKELIRKWYYQAYTNSSLGSPLENVNLSAYNTTGQLQFTALTNSSGLIDRQEVIEYVNTGGTRSYYNNYTINGTLSGYETDSNVFNFTTQQNKVDDFFTLNQLIPGENACGTLNTANTFYTLTQNVSSNETCFTITQPNITLDCNNYWINYTGTDVGNYFGIETNQFNTTVKNCNVYNFTIGIFFNGADNGTIDNNNITLYNNKTLSIDDNGLTPKASGILIYNFANYNTLLNNTAYSHYGRGIYINDADNNIIENSNGTSYFNPGIQVFDGSNNSIINSFALSEESIGIWLGYYGDHNSVINSTAISNLGDAIVSDYAEFTKIINSLANSSSAGGIYLLGVTNSNIINSTGISLSDDGITITYGSHNNTIFNSTGIGDHTGISIGENTFDPSNNNTVIDSRGVGGVAGIYLGGNNHTAVRNNATGGNEAYHIASLNNSQIIDCVYSDGGLNDIYYSDSLSKNNTFLNCSYESEYMNGIDGELIRKWYYQAYANYSNGTAVENANISAYNTTGQLQFTALTNSTGYISRQEVTEYVNTGGTKSYYNNYTINATLSGYETDSNIFNFTITQNKIYDVFTLYKVIPGENACGTLDSANTVYTLTQNVSSLGSCFTITAQNITLDCNGYWINYSINGTDYGRGIYTNQFNTTIKNCNIIDGNITNTNTNRQGIYFYQSSNGTIENNKVTSNNSQAVHLRLNSDFNNVNNNTIHGFSDIGLDIHTSNNNNITNNLMITGSSVDSGLVVYQSSNNLFVNNTGLGVGYGIYVVGTASIPSNDNLFINNTAISNAGDAIRLVLGEDNTFINQIATSFSSGDYAVIIDDVNNTKFIDCTNITASPTQIYIHTGTSLNNSFINCSYDSEWVREGETELIRKWYYQAYANYSNGTAVENANISAYNTTGDLQFTTSTNSSGLIYQQEITEYVNTGGTRSYYNNYTINATLSGYETDSNVFNFTTQQNKVDDFFTLDELTSCSCPGLDLNWEINMSHYCNITTNCNLGTGNITFVDVGETRFNALISTANLQYPSTGQTIFIQPLAVIEVG